MRVLVTGGSGFIGSHVVDKLRERGHEPVIYDLRPSPWHEPGSVDTVLGSITDREALERALHSCDAVAHLAAVADVNDVHAAPEDAERVNARGTVAVLEAARRAGVKRIVYASTIWVYSDCEPEEVDEETLLPPPSHLYTSTKLAGELYCKAYQELYGIDYTILRFGIPYGPRAREAAVIPAFVNKALAGEPLTLAGDGSQSRKFVYVEDLADGVALGLEDVAVNRVYNLACDESVTIKQIAETIKELIGDVEIVHTPARPGDFGGKIVSSERAERELGWTAATPFSEGVRKYIDWRQRAGRAPQSKEEAEAVIPAGEPDAESKPRQVLIISADIGEGHDLPARAVAREFRDEDPDAQISIVNGLPAMGPVLTKILRENSAFMFHWLPWLFDLQYTLFMKFAPTRWLARKLLTLIGRRGLMRLIRAHDPDVIVSTYPGVTAVLGEMRRKGKLNVPCYSSITDLAGPSVLGPPGDRPALHHAPRVGRGGRADRRAWQRALGQAADLAGVPGRAFAGRRAPRARRCPQPASRDRDLRRRLGGRRSGRRDRAGARGSRTRPFCACAVATRRSARDGRREARRRTAAADHRLHRADGRRAGGGRRARCTRPPG